jgi:hypothetical protein
VFLLPAWVSAHYVPLSSNLDGLGSERDFACGFGRPANVRSISEIVAGQCGSFGHVRVERATRSGRKPQQCFQRRFVALSAERLAEWMASDLSKLDLLACLGTPGAPAGLGTRGSR